MPNFKPVWILAKGERGTNSQVFATRQEANDSAAARFMVWTAPTGYDVDETDDPVTYFRTPERGDVSYAWQMSVYKDNLIDDMEMLRSGEWEPDDDSIDAYIDTIIALHDRMPMPMPKPEESN